MKHPRIILYDLLFITLLVLLAIISLLSYFRISDFSNKADTVSHTQTVNIKLNELLINIVNAETGQRGFIITKDSAFLTPFTGSSSKAAIVISQLDSLTADNPVQQNHLTQLKAIVKARLKLMNDNLFLFTGARYPQQPLKPYFEKGKRFMDEIRTVIGRMMAVENALLEERLKSKNRLAFVTPLYSLLLFLAGIIIVTVAYFKVRSEIALRYKAEVNAFESMQLQKLYKESENRLLNFADTVPVLIWLCDAGGSYYFFNSQWLNYTGRTMKQETGDGWMQAIHPADIEIYNDTFKFSFEARRMFYMECRIKNKENMYRWYSVKAEPRYDGNKEFLGYAGGCMEIEEQKNFAMELEKKVAERTLELKQLNEFLQIKNNIFAYAEENALMGSYSWNLQTGELEYSDNLFRLMGYRPGEFTPSFEKFISLIHPDDKEQVIANGTKTYETRQLSENIYRIYTKQGEIKHFRSSGNFIGEHKDLLVGSVQDVTKDIMLTATLTQKNLELLRNNEELQSFSYIASHDLQEPLRKIQSFSKILLEKEAGNFSEKGNDYFLRIITAAERMQHLIESLLDYSKVNSLEVKFVPTDLNEVLQEVQQNIAELIEQKKALIEVATLPNVNVMPLQFYQLFSNLIINSLKYSREQVNPVIKISSAVVQGEAFLETKAPNKKKFWKIIFSDNGIGFDQQYETKMFELFQRLHGRSEYEGTGIGLAICKKIVHNHNGFITAKGTPGAGADFIIYLPVDN